MKIKVPKLFRYITQQVLLAYFKLGKIYKPSLLSSLKIENIKKKSLYSTIVLVIFLVATALVVSSLGTKTTYAAGITKYARSTGGNWSAAATWSTTSNGAADTVAPTASDDVVFDNFSGPVTIDAASVAKSITCTGYTGTLTHNAFTLTVSGSITFVSGMTYTPLATSTIVMNASGTLTTGGKLIPLLNATSGTMTLGDNLSFMASKVMYFTLSGTAVDLNSKTVSGNSTINRLLIQSSVIGTAKTITVSAGTFANADFMDITFANGGSNLDLSAITGLSGDCGGNAMSGGGTLTFTTSATQTWTTANGGNWSGANWGAGRVPLPQDDVVMGMAYSGASKTVVADMPRLGRSIDWTGATGTPTWRLANYTETNMTSYGSLTLISGMDIYLYTTAMYHLAGRSSHTLTTAGKVIYRWFIDAPNGTYTLGDAFTGGDTLNVNAGGFNSAGYSITLLSGLVSQGAITRSVNITNSVVTITAWYTGWVVADAGLTLTTTSSTIAFSDTTPGNTNFIGGTQTYNNIQMAASTGFTTFSGAFTFANMTMSSAGTKTVKFTQGTTYTMTGTNFLSGTSGNLITIDSANGSSQFTLTKTGVPYISSDYLSLKDSAATPRTTWYAGTHSTDVSGNSGWTFSDPIIISNAGGSWSDASTWVGGVIPTVNDDVFASTTSGNVVLNSDAAVRNIDLTSYQGTLTHNAGVTLSVGNSSGGSLTFGSSMTYTILNNSTSTIRFVSTTTGNNLEWAGKSVGSVVFDGAGGNWIFQDLVTINGNLTINNSDTAGNGVDFNNQPVNVGGNFLMYAGKLTVGPSPFEVAGSRTVSGGTIVDSTTPYDYFKLSIDATTHNDYGASYPITYKFAIPSGSANLKVYKKYNVSDSWTPITEKTSSDFFNAVEAVRFDYPNNLVYVSAAFDSTSDDIYLKICDSSVNIVSASYQGIPLYYDNRQAAVTVTSDDWDGSPDNNAAFKKAADAFSSRKIWFTPGLMTQIVPLDWNEVQSKIDNGYIEIASHSRQHLGNVEMGNWLYYEFTGTHTGENHELYTMVNSAAGFPAGFAIPAIAGWTIDNTTDGSSCIITASTATTVTCAGGLSGGVENDWDTGDSYVIDRYDEETGGSRDDITGNLNLSPLNKKGSQQYVYAFIEPYGTYDNPTLHTKLGEYKYLIARTVGGANTYSTWDSTASTYNRIGTSYLYGDSNALDAPNQKFDSVVASGGIYHLWTHPYTLNWDPGSHVLDHLDYIKERTNLWYVGFGHLYLYHYIADQNKVAVVKVTPAAGTVPTSTPTSTATPTSSESVTPSGTTATPSLAHRLFSWITGATTSSSASFTTIPTDLSNIEVGQTITFDASSSGSNIVKYEWDFGDGTTSNEMKVDHKYDTPGRYTVTLTATDKSGNKSTVSKTIDIRPPAPTISNIKADGTGIVFEGKSFPETTVSLTIHSNPYTGQTVADKDGKFSYTVEKGSETIGEGGHTVLASAAVILSDNTQLKSKDSKTYDFKVSVDNGKLKVEMGKTKTWKYVSLGLGLLLIIGIGFVLIRARKRR